MKCLRCAHVDVVPGQGPVGEAVCPQCRGHFLDESQTTLVLVETLGLDRDLLGELAHHFAGAQPCPACRHRMSRVPVRGIDVELCRGCGSLFLDAGELERLTGERFASAVDEDALRAATLEPSSAAAPFSTDGGLRRASAGVTSSMPSVPKAAPETRGAVFLGRPEIATEVLVAAFAAAQFRTAIDARAAATTAHTGIAADEIAAQDAAVMIQILAKSGIEAAFAPPEVLALPPFKRSLEVTSENGVLSVADGHGRMVVVDVARVRGIAAARVRITATASRVKGDTETAMQRVAKSRSARIVPGLKSVAKIAAAFDAASAMPSTEIVEAKETFVDLVLDDVRYRFPESALILRSFHAPRTFVQAFAAVDALLPGRCFRSPGFTTLLAGEPPPELRSTRVFDRAIAWAAWRAGTTT